MTARPIDLKHLPTIDSVYQHNFLRLALLQEPSCVKYFFTNVEVC